MAAKNKKRIKKSLARELRVHVDNNKDFIEKIELVKKFQPKTDFYHIQKESMWTIAQ